ncbi:MAG: hypothetical protein K8M05_20600 [Deltaproteobacteria bacterium]|nr:hypothetical protein [Kofleriaceae bacterium]
MTTVLDPIVELDQLLANVGAEPVLVRKRVAASTLYDADYHMAMIACAFALHAPRGASGPRQILRAWLKLLQFVASRPRLAPHLKRWATTRGRQADLETWRRMPRGYVGDQTHDAVVDLLVANHALAKNREHVQAGTAIATLDTVFQEIVEAGLFITERAVIEDLKGVPVSRAMLGGG